MQCDASNWLQQTCPNIVLVLSHLDRLLGFLYQVCPANPYFPNAAAPSWMIMGVAGHWSALRGMRLLLLSCLVLHTITQAHPSPINTNVLSAFKKS